MNKRTTIILYVNEEAEKFYADSEKIGTIAAETFSKVGNADKKEKSLPDLQKHRSQMTGLENIADTTLKVTDVLDFIKKQIARPHGWNVEYQGKREEYRGKRFGESLKKYIEEDIKLVGKNIASKVSGADERDRQYIYLQLVRQFIRQVVVQYEYRVSQIAEDLQQDDQRARAGANTAPQR